MWFQAEGVPTQITFDEQERQFACNPVSKEEQDRAASQRGHESIDPVEPCRSP